MIIDKKYTKPICEVISTDLTYSFMYTSNPIDGWGNDNDPFKF